MAWPGLVMYVFTNLLAWDLSSSLRYQTDNQLPGNLREKRKKTSTISPRYSPTVSSFRFVFFFFGLPSPPPFSSPFICAGALPIHSFLIHSTTSKSRNALPTRTYRRARRM
ncbi:hypothetical protein B0T19DRAFT_410560, partial [Cercophora scortea]